MIAMNAAPTNTATATTEMKRPPSPQETSSAANTPTGAALFKVKGLSRWFEEAHGRVNVIRNVDLEINRGERVAIIGASGSGKTTLLQILGGLDSSDAGEVSLDGVPWNRLSAHAAGRRRNRYLGFVYQFHHLLPELSALENVALPLLIRGESSQLARQRSADMLDRIGLSERHRHKPGALSGGERARVAIARALIARPAAVLADEPTGNLDTERAHQVFELLLELNREAGSTLIVVTHDPSLAERLDRRLIMNRGRLIES